MSDMNNDDAITDDELMKIGEGTYSGIKHFPDGNRAWVARMIFTVAILYGVEPYGYRNRWCYHTMADARRALEEWDGAPGTEPQGWHRHPDTGRRRDDDGQEYVAP